jgi:hypothetical protein
MRTRIALVLALLAPCPGAALAAEGDRIVEVHYDGSAAPGELAYGVTYRAWFPGGAGRLRGAIVHQHGCGQGACEGGWTAAEDLQWQALARKWDCALIGPSYEQKDGQDCALWCDPRNGSRSRFLLALRDLGAKAGHPELEGVPWCLWGHSGGGTWSSLMLCSDPGRVVAAWLRSGTALSSQERPGRTPPPAVPDAAYAVPIVCNPGVREKGDARFHVAWTGAEAMTRAFRAKGAPIAMAPDPTTGHDCGRSRTLAIPFFDACLAARLPEEGSPPDAPLRAIDRDGGWRAALLGDTPVPAGDFRADPAVANWLIDERFARAWSAYVRTGTVPDATPPPAPRGLKATRTPEGVVLTWDTDADLESGLAAVAIERDGEELARLPDAATPGDRRLFQGLSYHDTPSRPVPPPRFVDADPAIPAGARYRVVAVNGAGGKSEPSAVAVAP